VIAGWRVRLLPAPAPGVARTPLVLVTTALVGLATFVVTLGLGEMSVAPADVVRALVGQTSADGAFVVTELRLPRALVACCVGAGLAAAGVVLQGLTRNALAAPELVGVSAGAHCAAVVVIVLLPDLPISVLPACAFAGALVTSAVVYGLSWRRGTSGSRLLLVGIAVTTVGYAIVLGVISTVEDLIHASQLVTFMAGSVYGSGWPEFGAALPWLVLLLPLVALSIRELDALALGDPVARGLGVRVEAARLRLLVLAAGLAGSAVAVAGPVGFVGLMSPHIARRLVGGAHGPLLATSVLLGATIMLLADALARLAFAPVDVPVGVVTAVVGAPYLLWLLARGRANPE
jgi:iron-siderophore transport system permease protein